MKRWAAFVAAAALAAAGGVAGAADGGEREQLEPGKWHISTDGELFSLSANEVYLEDLLLAIRRMSRGEVRIEKAPNRKVSARYFNVTLDELLSRLGLDYFLFFSREGESSEYSLDSGWIGDAGGQRVDPAFPALLMKGSAEGPPGGALSPEVRALLSDPETAAKDLGVTYRAPMPMTVALDGNISDWPEGIPWQKVSHEMGVNAPTNDADGSSAVASSSDGTNIYLAIDINDDIKSFTNAIGPRLPVFDDAIQLLMDREGGGVPSDGKADVSFLINRHHQTRKTETGYVASPRQFVGQSVGTKAVIVSKENGWQLEVSVPISALNVKPGENPSFGLNLVLHDVDAGENSEHVLVWSRSARLGDLSSPSAQNNLGEMKLIDIRP